MRRTILAAAALLLPASLSPARALQGEAEVLRLFADLPVEFLLEEESELPALSPSGEQGRIWRLRSVEPVRETAVGALYARASLSAWTLGGPEAADAEVRRRLASADPDTGLTYAWDVVAARGDVVLHLHAECTMPAEVFLQVSARLRAAAGSAPRQASFLCRCGAGCRPQADKAAAAGVPPGLPRVRPTDPDWDQYDNRLDPSGSWESDVGQLSLMHHASALSFTYLAVFGATAHICEVAGVAGLVGTDRYEWTDEQGAVTFVVSERAVRLELTEGIASFCGAGWSGDSFFIERHRPPSRCVVTAARAAFHVTDSVRPERRGAFVVRGDVVEAVPAQPPPDLEMMLGRFVRPGTAVVGLLRADELDCRGIE